VRLLTPIDFRTYCSISSSVELKLIPRSSRRNLLRGGRLATFSNVLTAMIMICLSEAAVSLSRRLIDYMGIPNGLER
jgi:hypothetical protein